MSKEKLIIDYETGEIIGEINEGDKIIRKSSIDYLSNTIELNSDIPFIKLFINHDFTLAKELTGIEVTMVMYLYNYISYESCILCFSNHKFLKTVHISKYLNISENRIYKIMTNLVNKQVLSRCRVGRETIYIMNPYIFQKGKRVNKTLKKLFENTKWAKRFH